MIKNESTAYNTLKEQLKTFEEKLAAVTKDISENVRKANAQTTAISLKQDELAVKARDPRYRPLYQQAIIAFFKGVWNRILATISYLGEQFTKLVDAGAHYVVFFLVLALLIVGTSTGMTPSSPNSETNEKISGLQIKDMSVVGRIIYSIKKFFKSIFSFNYSMKSYLRMFRKPDETQLSRQVDNDGRCDNLNHIAIDDPAAKTDACNTGKFCVSATVPKDISWNVDTNTIAGYDKLPDSVKTDEKLKLYMPFVVNGSFYEPNCEGTYYMNASGNKQYVRLYETDGPSCRLHEVPRTEYKDFKQRKDNTYEYR